MFSFILVGFELETKTVVREADSNCPSPVCSRLISAEVVFWLPVLVAALSEGQSFIVMHGLAIVCLCIQFRSLMRNTSNYVKKAVVLKL